MSNISIQRMDPGLLSSLRKPAAVTSSMVRQAAVYLHNNFNLALRLQSYRLHEMSIQNIAAVLQEKQISLGEVAAVLDKTYQYYIHHKIQPKVDLDLEELVGLHRQRLDLKDALGEVIQINSRLREVLEQVNLLYESTETDIHFTLLDVPLKGSDLKMADKINLETYLIRFTRGKDYLGNVLSILQDIEEILWDLEPGVYPLDVLMGKFPTIADERQLKAALQEVLIRPGNTSPGT